MTERYGQARLGFFPVKEEFVKLRASGWKIKAIYKKFLTEEKLAMSYKTFWVYADRFENPNKNDRGFDPVTLQKKKN